MVLDIEREELQQVQYEVAMRTRAMFDESMSAVWERVFKLVKHMQNALNEYGQSIDGSKRTKTFRDSLVDNVAELVDILPALNVTGDAKLHEMTERIKAELVAHPAEKLREDPNVRNDVKKSADEIVNVMSSFLNR